MMDENLKKPKRPRIGETSANLNENMENGRYEKVEYKTHEPNQGDENNAAEGIQQHDDYQQRPPATSSARAVTSSVKAATNPATSSARAVTSSVKAVTSSASRAVISPAISNVTLSLKPWARRPMPRATL